VVNQLLDGSNWSAHRDLTGAPSRCAIALVGRLTHLTDGPDIVVFAVP
jgi:hypothetical protein